jgi:hypothetical protein
MCSQVTHLPGDLEHAGLAVLRAQFQQVADLWHWHPASALLGSLQDQRHCTKSVWQFVLNCLQCTAKGFITERFG